MSSPLDTSQMPYKEPKYYDQYNVSIAKDIGVSEFQSSITNCHACLLSKYEKPLTFTNVHAPLMIVGETPEDVTTYYENGKMLYQILNKIGLSVDNVYMTAAVKCLHSTNFSFCHRHLIAEMIMIQPLVIIALGYNAGFLFFENQQQIQPGMTTHLPNGSDFIITFSLNDIKNNQALSNAFYHHLSLAKSQLELRLQQRGELNNEKRIHSFTGS